MRPLLLLCGLAAAASAAPVELRSFRYHHVPTAEERGRPGVEARSFDLEVDVASGELRLLVWPAPKERAGPAMVGPEADLRAKLGEERFKEVRRALGRVRGHPEEESMLRGVQRFPDRPQEGEFRLEVKAGAFEHAFGQRRAPFARAQDGPLASLGQIAVHTLIQRVSLPVARELFAAHQVRNLPLPPLPADPTALALVEAVLTADAPLMDSSRKTIARLRAGTAVWIQPAQSSSTLVALSPAGLYTAVLGPKGHLAGWVEPALLRREETALGPHAEAIRRAGALARPELRPLAGPALRQRKLPEASPLKDGAGAASIQLPAGAEVELLGGSTAHEGWCWVRHATVEGFVKLDAPLGASDVPASVGMSGALGESQAPAGPLVVREVARNDNLWTIAREHGLTIDALLALAGPDGETNRARLERTSPRPGTTRDGYPALWRDGGQSLLVPAKK